MKKEVFITSLPFLSLEIDLLRCTFAYFLCCFAVSSLPPVSLALSVLGAEDPALPCSGQSVRRSPQITWSSPAPHWQTPARVPPNPTHWAGRPVAPAAPARGLAALSSGRRDVRPAPCGRCPTGAEQKRLGRKGRGVGGDVKPARRPEMTKGLLASRLRVLRCRGATAPGALRRPPDGRGPWSSW